MPIELSFLILLAQTKKFERFQSFWQSIHKVADDHPSGFGVQPQLLQLFIEYLIYYVDYYCQVVYKFIFNERNKHGKNNDKVSTGSL